MEIINRKKAADLVPYPFDALIQIELPVIADNTHFFAKHDGYDLTVKGSRWLSYISRDWYRSICILSTGSMETPASRARIM